MFEMIPMFIFVNYIQFNLIYNIYLIINFKVKLVTKKKKIKNKINSKRIIYHFFNKSNTYLPTDSQQGTSMMYNVNQIYVTSNIHKNMSKTHC